jgi:hypothetical protein
MRVAASDEKTVIGGNRNDFLRSRARQLQRMLGSLVAISNGRRLGHHGQRHRSLDARIRDQRCDNGYGTGRAGADKSATIHDRPACIARTPADCRHDPGLA